ncbi:DUF1820 family protein [Hahella sp. SMD15-11]|uniref:DUF1820 family protein n=1 Tax=Thermohahella caldifontis TaxID=3142973 RepID=A0AB39UXP5_9GAMM
MGSILMTSSNSGKIYRIVYINHAEVFEMYASSICQSDLWGFIEVEGWMFGERSQVLVDPGEEKLKGVFEGVKRSWIPVNAIVRIDEVSQRGSVRVSDARVSNITPFPKPPVKG